MPTKGKYQKDEHSSTLPWLKIAGVAASYFLVECYAYALLQPGDWMGLAFGLAWAVLLGAVTLCLPKLAGRIVYGVSYFVMAG